jgi:hypothetical protein
MNDIKERLVVVAFVFSSSGRFIVHVSYYRQFCASE